MDRIYNIQSGNSFEPEEASFSVSTSTPEHITLKITQNKKMADKAGIFDLSKLISNQGYDCIVESIFTNMDPVTLAKCRLVSKSWKALIDNRRTILVRQLQQLKQNKLEVPDAKVWHKLRRIVESQRKYSIIEKFPEFKQIFLYLQRNATGRQVRSTWH